MVRVLCLHGWGTNSEIFTYQLHALRTQFQSEVEFVVLQATLEVDAQTDERLLSRFKGKYFAWYTTHTVGEGVEFVWRDRSVRQIKEHIENCGYTYDGILGFSQGCSMLALLLSLQNQGLFPSSFKFAIFVSPGFIPSTSLLATLPRGLPTAFFLGEQDIFSSVGYLTARCFLRPAIYLHHSGHRFPKLTPEVVRILRQTMFGDTSPRL